MPEAKSLSKKQNKLEKNMYEEKQIVLFLLQI